MRSQRAELSGAPVVELSGNEANVRATVRYQIERGDGRLERREINTVFVIRKTGSQWRIARILQ